uniref:DOMON domain-containing protein n=1 Tax=Toxocara canis TaxID=6265 RepID=A0A183URC5_TOXCA
LLTAVRRISGRTFAVVRFEELQLDSKFIIKMSRISRQQTVFCIAFLAVSLVFAENEMLKCGVSQICIRDPPGCSPDSACKFVAAFSRTDDPEQMRLRLRAQSSAPRPYVAIRFSDTRIPLKSTVIYCSPKDRILRFGYERDGRVDFASRGISDKMASVSSSWAKDGMVECEFDRVITAPKRMLAAQSLTSPLHVQLITGSISSDGFPMSPSAAYTADSAVDFGAVKRLPILKTNAAPEPTKSSTRTTIEEEISEEQLKSIPEVDESKVPVEVDGIDVDYKKKSKGGTLKSGKKAATTKADKESGSNEKSSSQTGDKTQDKSVTSKKKYLKKIIDSEEEEGTKSKKHSSKIKTDAGESAESENDDDILGSSKMDDEKKNKKKKRPFLGSRTSNSSHKSFSLFPGKDGSFDEDDDDISKEDFNSTKLLRAGYVFCDYKRA